MSASKSFCLLLAASAASIASCAYGQDRVPDLGARAANASAPKIPSIKTVTNFSQALRCMDELFLANGKKGIVITSGGIPDETGKVKTGTKEMLITAMGKMTVKSGAFEFIDFFGGSEDLNRLFEAKGDQARSSPDYYIRGSITQMDDNAVKSNKGFGISLPFLDLGYSKDEAYTLISMDMSVGEASTRKILPETSTSNTMVIFSGGKSGEAGGKLGKVGLSFNLDTSRSEGLGQTTRTLLELGLIETLGKFTKVPYWKCLDVDITNPLIREQALEGYEMMNDKDRILFVQRKMGGSMGRYKGPLNGIWSEELKGAIAEYQAQNGLTATGKLDFDLYASLLDDTQNVLAALPPTPAASTFTPGRMNPPAASAPASSGQVVASAPPAAANAQFRLTLESDRGTRPSYKSGEFLNLNLSLNSDGTAYCYYEDAAKNTARIFPNQFQPNSQLRASSLVKLPAGGFKIRFDQAGRERVACIAADRELSVPQSLKGAKDLSRLPVRSLDEVVDQFKQSNPAAVASYVDITVAK